jgi:hypothetical protein
MIHQTKWIEISHLFFRCDGCSIQCRTFGSKPKDNIECDGSLSRIQEIIKKKEGK